MKAAESNAIKQIPVSRPGPFYKHTSRILRYKGLFSFLGNIVVRKIIEAASRRGEEISD
jgi:hypothetical protein